MISPLAPKITVPTSIFQPVTRKNWDEGAAQRATRRQLKEQVGDAKRSKIGVIFRRGAKLCANDDLARQAREPAEHEKEHDQQRSARHTPAVQSWRRLIGRGVFLMQ